MGNPRTAAGPQAPVDQVMASATIGVAPEDSLATAAQRMAENDVGALPVLDGPSPRGMVTERDLVRAVADGVDLTTEPVSARMTAPLESVGPDTSLELASGRMLERGIRHLAVVDGGRLVGIVSIRDLLTAYATFIAD